MRRLIRAVIRKRNHHTYRRRANVFAADSAMMTPPGKLRHNDANQIITSDELKSLTESRARDSFPVAADEIM
jgi:hypothetical protein